MALNEYPMLGDKIFVPRPPCFLALLMNPTAAEQVFQTFDSLIRTTTEWANGKLTMNWGYITYERQLKVGLRAVGRDIIVAALLTNALVLSNGDQTPNYFTHADQPFMLDMPSLEDYFNYI